MHNFPYNDQSNLVLMRVPVYLYIDDFEIGKPIEVNGYGEHSTGNLVLDYLPQMQIVQLLVDLYE